ncbi:hypothetical protein PENTCL1PPCAC_21207 [Pristionchus entomophagus]|uniref:Uncharacterized protein n=1 Tax=Pristionchus entomophagus TaxID=358040 RepID=A0AAV5TY53_9BILA|nr:hypothetical protein PENTCL1PPCAC_21207 [Pristionchus entomophagus]
MTLSSANGSPAPPGRSSSLPLDNATHGNTSSSTTGAAPVSQSGLISHSSATSFLPLNASAGASNVLDGILAYLRKNDENMERMEQKLDGFILQYAPLIKDGADFAKATVTQLEGFTEWKEEMKKENKKLKNAVDQLNEKIPAKKGFHYTYLTRERVDAINKGSLNPARLAIRLQKAIYKKQPREKLKNVEDRVDQAAVKFIFDCVIYRREFSTKDQKDLAMKAMQDRLNQYAANGRAERDTPLIAFTRARRSKNRRQPNPKGKKRKTTATPHLRMDDSSHSRSRSRSPSRSRSLSRSRSRSLHRSRESSVGTFGGNCNTNKRSRIIYSSSEDEDESDPTPYLGKKIKQEVID